MRRSWRGRYRNNYYRSRNYKNTHSDADSINNSSRAQVPSTSGSSRAPANQLPIVLPILNQNDYWKLYFPNNGKDNISSPLLYYIFLTISDYIATFLF